MMKLATILLLTTSLFATAAPASAAAASATATSTTSSADPFLGTWVLDPHESKYATGTCPRGMTIQMTAIANGVHYHSLTTLQNGTAFDADYTATYDGAASLVTGARGILLPVTLQRINPRTVVARYTSGLEVRATSRRTISADGQTMTVTTTSGNGSGATFTNTGIYHRQHPTPHTFISQTKTDLLQPR